MQPEKCQYYISPRMKCLRDAKVVSDDSRWPYCADHSKYQDRDGDVYRAVGDHFRQDTREFWTRSSFYMVVQAAIFAIYSQSSSQSTGYRAAICCVGIIMAAYWWLVARSSLKWSQAWGGEFKRLERIVDPRRTYARVEREVESKLPLKVRKERVPHLDEVSALPLASTGAEVKARRKIVLHPNELGLWVPVVFVSAWGVLMGLVLAHV